MRQREEIAQHALTLSPKDREYVIDVLESSLCGEGFASTEIATAWEAEIRRRLASYESGSSRAIPAEDAMRELRQMLEAHRSGLAR